MADPRSLELKLESKVDSVDAAELIVQGLAREAGHPEDEIDHLGMAVRESMVNAVTHGNGYSAEKWVYFSARVEKDGGLRVGIRDEGEGFEPRGVPDPTAPENLLKTSGRGLLLMRALVDEFSVERAEPRGMQVTMFKKGPGAKRG
ncbi:MAG: ATP-binding protein [Acidobacteria bacterium]|nr:ATP-binding protein [Acidobacteriota bacterium]